MKTVILDLRTTVEECEAVINAFQEKGYTAYFDSKARTLKTTAPETRIKELSERFHCIQSYSITHK